MILVLRYLSMSGGEVVARGETAESTVNFVPGDGLPRPPFLGFMAGDGITVGDTES